MPHSALRDWCLRWYHEQPPLLNLLFLFVDVEQSWDELRSGAGIPQAGHNRLESVEHISPVAYELIDGQPLGLVIGERQARIELLM